MSLLFTVSIIGLWAGSIYVPTAVTQIALREGYTAAEAARLASYGGRGARDRHDHRLPARAGAGRSASVGDRRWRCTSSLMFVGIAFGFGTVFYMQNALMPFFVLDLRPRPRRRELRALHALDARAMHDRVPRQRDRLHQLGRPLRRRRDGVPRRRAGSSATASLGVPVALTAVAFVIGLLVLPAAQETKGQPLPPDFDRIQSSSCATRRSSRTTAASSTASRSTIHAGEHTAIIGPNGAGKSALVSLLTHDDRPLRHEDGSPSVLGVRRRQLERLRSASRSSASSRPTCITGSCSATTRGASRAEAAVLSGFLATQGILRYGAVTPEMRTRAAEALARMGVAHLAKRRLDEMSTGRSAARAAGARARHARRGR